MGKTLMVLAAAAFLCLSAACTSRFVVIPSKYKTERHHFIVVDYGGPARTIYDCYSRPNGSWQPTCREVDWRLANEPSSPGDAGAPEQTPDEAAGADRSSELGAGAWGDADW